MFIIFGSPRSGTTLLAQCLDANSKIVVPHETDFIIPSAFLFDRIADVQIRKRLLSDLIVNSNGFRTSIGEYISADDVREIVFRCGDRMSELLVGIYSAIAKKGGGTIAGDKSPNDILFLIMLVGSFTPEIRIIHIVRDIRDVMASLLPLNWSEDLELYFPRAWSNSNLYLHCLYHDKPEYILVRYEDFVRLPEVTLKRVCAHVGADFQPEQLSPERRHPRYRSHPPHSKLFQHITASDVGHYRGKLDAALVELIERQAAEAMGVFDYDFGSTARAEVEALRAAQAKAEAAAETARAEVEALRASTSWRITAPLRSIARRLRR